ncbi:MAG: hypothetical protein KHX53_01285 [Bacteroides sp.]|nr:hypothetical protein [Bacteroides sp.]
MKKIVLSLALCLPLVFASCNDGDEVPQDFFSNTLWKQALDTSYSKYEVIKFESDGTFEQFKEDMNGVIYEITKTSGYSYRVDEGNFKVIVTKGNNKEEWTYEGVPPIYLHTPKGKFVRQLSE